MKQKQSYGILSKPIILGRNKISIHTKAAVLLLYEDGEFTHLMPGIKILQVFLEIFVNKNG